MKDLTKPMKIKETRLLQHFHAFFGRSITSQGVNLLCLSSLCSNHFSQLCIFLGSEVDDC